MIRPDVLELADTQRLEAMRDLLREVGHEDGVQESDLTLDGLLQYTDFFRMLFPKMQAKHGDRSQVQLDRFLKAYGNRHVLAKIAGKIPPTIEPAVCTLDWESMPCKSSPSSKSRTGRTPTYSSPVFSLHWTTNRNTGKGSR